MDGFDPRIFAELVGRFAIRSTVLPPAAMAMLNDDPAVVDLAPLRYVRSITAPLSPLQARRFADKFGVVVLNGYGQAEIGEVIGWTAADAREHPDKLGAVGRPHPGVSIRIAPTRGRRRPAIRRRHRAAPRAAPEHRGRYRGGTARRRRLRRHRRPGPHRRRGFRVDRGPRERRHQSRRQQGVPRARRRGAPARTRRRRGRGRGGARRTARRDPGRVRGHDHRTSPTTSSSPSAVRTSRRTRSRPRSDASTRCPAARSARCSGATSRRRTSTRGSGLRRRDRVRRREDRATVGPACRPSPRRRARCDRAPTRRCCRPPSWPRPSRS